MKRVQWWLVMVAAVALMVGVSACGDDDDENGGSGASGGNGGGAANTTDAAKALEGEFVEQCGDYHAKCIGGEGVEPEQYEGACMGDFESHLETAADPEACVEARIAQWECLYEPCPSEADEPDRCQEEQLARGAACNPPHDGPGASSRPSISYEDFVGACADYLNTCGEDGSLGSVSDCEANWYNFEAYAEDFGQCVEAQKMGWECLLESGCEMEEPSSACMQAFQDSGNYCSVSPG